MAAVLVLALALAASGAGRAAAAAEEASAPSDWDMFANGLQVLWGAYDGCARGAAGDVAACLKLRALRSAERALRAERLPLLGGLAFVRAQGRDGRGLADDEPPPLDEAALPADAAAKQRALDEALLDRVARFFKGHSLQLDEARLLEDDGAGDEGEQGAQDGEDGAVAEGRKKKGFKKYGGALLLGLMMKGGLMAMAWKGVALMAGKALMVAKIALVLSAVVALKKLSHGGHGEEKVTYEIVKHPHVSHTQTFSTGHDFGGHDFGGSGSGGGGGHYKRSLDPLQPQNAHALAYSAHAPDHAHAHWHAPYPRARLNALQQQQQKRPQVALYHYPSTQEILQHQEQLEEIHKQQLREQEQQQQQQEYAYEVNDPTQDAEQDVQPVYPYPQQ